MQGKNTRYDKKQGPVTESPCCRNGDGYARSETNLVVDSKEGKDAKVSNL